MTYLQEHMDELNSRIEKVEELEGRIEEISGTIKLDSILEQVGDASRMDQYSAVRKAILGLHTDDDLRNLFPDTEDLLPLQTLASDVFNSSTKIVRDGGTESPERLKSHLLHEIISTFVSIAYEAITGRGSRGGSLIRETYS